MACAILRHISVAADVRWRFLVWSAVLIVVSGVLAKADNDDTTIGDNETTPLGTTISTTIEPITTEPTTITTVTTQTSNLPSSEITGSITSTPSIENNTSAGDNNTTSPPSLENNTSSAEINTSSAEINTSSAEINTSSAEINTSAAEINTSSAEINTSAAEIDTSSAEINTSSAENNITSTERAVASVQSTASEQITTTEAPENSNSTISAATTTEKLEILTESASELALQSVHSAVIVQAPPEIQGDIHPSIQNIGYDGFDIDEDDFEGSGFGDDFVDEFSDDHDFSEYDEDDENISTDPPAPVPSPEAVVASTTTTTTTKTTTTTTTEQTNAEVLELNKESTTEVSETSPTTTPKPRRPRHSQLDDDADLPSPAPAPRQAEAPASPSSPRPAKATARRRRPSRFKDERRVNIARAASTDVHVFDDLRDDGSSADSSSSSVSSSTPKRRKVPKQASTSTTTLTVPVIVDITTEKHPDYLALENSIKPHNVNSTTPRRRPKRRKKKVRRPKEEKLQNPSEGQVPAETRAAIEAASAAAAAESLQSDLFPAPSPSSKPQEKSPVARAIRQDDVSIQQSDVNPDGSYSFSYDIADAGRHSKTEVGDANNVVSGRYGYIDANGRPVNTEYSAGPRGFRASGPDIARTMDLSQVGGPAPVPPPDGRYSPEYASYSDPNEDPSYRFRYRTDTALRSEIADSRGDVRGKYEFIDDDGEKHVVRYEAGAEKGFNVRTAFPDNAIPPGLFFPGRGRVPSRGRSSILQHRNGAYRFTAVGPDSRREECSDSSNYRRGSYVYLDDKGVRRTVIYEAGPNIGYRVITNPSATIPRCSQWKEYPDWPNIPLEIGVDGPYISTVPTLPEKDGFGASTPGTGSTLGTFIDDFSDNDRVSGGGGSDLLYPTDTTYPKKPFPTTRPRPRPTPKPSITITTESRPIFDTKPTPDSRPSYDRPTPGSRPSYDRPTQEPRPSYDRPTPSSRPSYDRPTSDSRPSYDRPTPDTRPITPRPTSDTRPITPRPTSDTRPISSRPTSDSRPISSRPTSDPRPTTYKPFTTPTSPADFPEDTVYPIPLFPPPAPRPTKRPSFSTTGVKSFDRIFPTTESSFKRDPSPNRGNPNRGDGSSNGVTPSRGDGPPRRGGPSRGSNSGKGSSTTREPPRDNDSSQGVDDSSSLWSTPQGSNPPRDSYPKPSSIDADGYRQYSCCGPLRLAPAVGDPYGRVRPIRTYIQSIDLSADDALAPGRAESPSEALERHVREQERKSSRRQQRRRRRRRSEP